MNEINLKSYFAMIILIFLFGGCNNVESNRKYEKINEFIKIDLPVFKTAENIKEGFNKKYIIRYSIYNVNMAYPAEELINFYYIVMAQRGFIPLIEGHYANRNRKWNTYVDGTQKGNPDVTSSTMGWVSKDKTKRATLVLKYYWYNKEKKRVLNSNKDLEVEFNIQLF